jgi:hypothetical protein
MSKTARSRGAFAAAAVAVVGVAWLAATGLAAQTAAPARVTDGAAFNPAGALIRPADYREWVYVTTGLGMSYGPQAAAAAGTAARPPVFDNVFVNRESYRTFLRTGRWADGTMFILELRRGESHVSIDTSGQTQGALVAIEASVKDSTRFASTGGWAYFGFGSGNALAESATANPPTASCYACHRDNTAVDNTFVQFYPTLFEVATRLGTVKPTYNPAHRP